MLRRTAMRISDSYSGRPSIVTLTVTVSRSSVSIWSRNTEAEASTHGDKVDVILAQAFEALPKFPESVLRYVIRTQESVILDDASAENPFSDDAYVSLRRPRSILCLPLVKQRELAGVLYLENNLAPRVFAPERLAGHDLLAAQASISFKNPHPPSDSQHQKTKPSTTQQN